MIGNWATSGPFGNASWLEIIYTILAAVALMLCLGALIEAWLDNASLKKETTNGRLVLAKGRVVSSLFLVGMSLGLLAEGIGRMFTRSAPESVGRLTFFAGGLFVELSLIGAVAVMKVTRQSVISHMRQEQETP